MANIHKRTSRALPEAAPEKTESARSPRAAKTTINGSREIGDGNEEEQATRIGVTDVLRVLGGVILLSSVLSWFVTNESVLWGYRPAFTRVSGNGNGQQQRGSVHLTDAELARYDGSDMSLPIYVAVNGTIYDVSANPHMYGPGGSYHFFAGKDATRAFVTGCFAEDLTPDLRGVEEMYMPVDGEEGEQVGWTSGERKKRQAQDLRLARKKVRESVAHWEGFFGKKSGKYFEVGTVKREEEWLERLPRRDLCEPARKSRPKRNKIAD
ncbi:MAG: hypothetical protein M1830_010395 [Pleopsidium flavum]|nr:MAG: hypothetical protein M1830_010395 [Pleopsidium flavum]